MIVYITARKMSKLLGTNGILRSAFLVLPKIFDQTSQNRSFPGEPHSPKAEAQFRIIGTAGSGWNSVDHSPRSKRARNLAGERMSIPAYRAIFVRCLSPGNITAASCATPRFNEHVVIRLLGDRNRRHLRDEIVAPVAVFTAVARLAGIRIHRLPHSDTPRPSRRPVPIDSTFRINPFPIRSCRTAPRSGPTDCRGSSRRRTIF